MKKFLLLLAMTLLLATPALAAQKTWVNGIDANYPPFAYIDEKGNPAGFDVDSMNWIAAKMGFAVTHKPIAWDGIIPALLAKQIDMICSGMSITAERAKQVNFSAPYWTVSRVFLVPAASALTPPGHSGQARQTGCAARHLRGRGHPEGAEGKGLSL